jgi:hypothetical protein
VVHNGGLLRRGRAGKEEFVELLQVVLQDGFKKVGEGETWIWGSFHHELLWVDH